MGISAIDAPWWSPRGTTHGEVNTYHFKEHDWRGGWLTVSVPHQGIGNILLTDFPLEGLGMDNTAALAVSWYLDCTSAGAKAAESFMVAASALVPCAASSSSCPSLL